jgi:hypothetical protein
MRPKVNDSRVLLSPAPSTQAPPRRPIDGAGFNPTFAHQTNTDYRCQEAFDTEQARRLPSKRLRAPAWPAFPAALDVEHPPSWVVSYEYDHRLDLVLSISHWLDALCSRWEDLEEQRLSRSLLRKLDGDDERSLPIVLVDAP